MIERNMTGPIIPAEIQQMRNKRFGRNSTTGGEESISSGEVEAESSDDDFVGPKLAEFEYDEKEEELRAKERLLQTIETKSHIEINDSKHDAWMSMKPTWFGAEKKAENTYVSTEAVVDHIDTERDNMPSLLELHQQQDKKSTNKFDHDEALNMEIRKEIFRKANSLNDRFSRGV